VARWAFAKAPYVRRNRSHEQYFAERATLVAGEVHGGLAKLEHHFRDAYHIGVELRTEAKGDTAASGRNAIEEAAAQVCRGMNGLVGFFASNAHLLPAGDKAILLPVVFTTAEVWTTDVDLGAADTITGKLPDNIAATQV